MQFALALALVPCTPHCGSPIPHVVLCTTPTALLFRAPQCLTTSTRLCLWPALALVSGGGACAASGVALRSLPCSLNTGSAGFYASASHPKARGHPVARGGVCLLPRAAASGPRLCSLDAGNAGFLRWREPTCGAMRRMCCLEDGFKVAAVLARRRQRWLLRWREPPCGAKQRVCCLERCGFETLLCSLDAGSAGFYASASHPVARGHPVWRKAARVAA